MATKYVTLKDSNGDTLYPQAVATNLAPGSIDTTELADGAVTSAKLKGWSTANTTDEWVPVATSTRELQHRLIKPFNADGTIPTSAIANSAVTNSKIDWSTVTSTSISASDFVTSSTGYTISTSNLYKTGNLLVGTIVITKDSGTFGVGQINVGTVKTGYRPKTAANYFAGLGESTWSVKAACYFYVGSDGTIYINNQTGVTGCNSIKALITWFTA